ncbi:protein-disulfide reductase DsbD domain-containing protein [uncultured Methylobacterium sp.]|uniref:protein-disulfide reductase DsbD family protein n=1 Tax=uncultured Methylobacterium sp. TaxID=157278 RepID=UPI002605E177|nr:protein-disulfide reductase DsbD domain-containing protein [uncultured Methylobacterium sp.]
MLILRRLRTVALIAWSLLAAGSALAQAPRAGARPADLVRVDLLAEPGAVEAGRPFTVGVRLTMKPNWHVYWRNPGDSGLPPEIAWTLPAGFSAGPIAWPAPERIPVADLMNYGYEGETVLTVLLTPPEVLPPGPVAVRATVSYLVCERECVPGEATVSASLPVAPPGTSVRRDPRTREIFAAARADLPRPAPWPWHGARDGDALVLTVAAPDLAGEAIRDVALFPYGESTIENAAPQVASVDAAGLRLRLRPAAGEGPAPLDGVLTFRTGAGERRAYALGEPPAATGPGASTAAGVPAPPPAPADAPESLWGAVLLALLGGLVLNLMPCVFPVLSIKVLSLVRHSGEGPARIRLHGLAYTAGVLAAFLALAGTLIALRAGGAGVGWGFQLQSPLVVAGLAYGLFAMALGLSGAFQFGAGLAGLGDGLARRSGLQGSFFAGLLATVVATPCTAPFMGAAVGFALTRDAATCLAVFAALGLGLALPFAVLTAWPAALRRLPRPGPWMETLKQVLAFPLYATVAWLTWVLSQQVGSGGLFAALLGFVLVGFCAFALDKGRAAGPVGRRLAVATAVATVALLGGLVAMLDRDRAAPAVTVAGGAEPFTQARLDALRAEGRPVLVDMTAAWCITCQVNERLALRSEAVREAMAARGVVLLRGDWTNQNPEITRVLEAHGRSGVPLYLLYDGRGGVTVLPQILTAGLVRDAIEALPAAGGARAALQP